ncbi:lanthionine synthetase C family protein [Yinghuangia sp. ASG 101]|uniref:lanthionine synthetase C family protein n=1 Tax=Yinghuangia sp. ASG 101 TaxID=2896848 RepID=UPI001E52F063|nr:lanthionine synthetase C family protein [Yinghuangia sp. ASG 101]UGQ10490.1 lanthionine synthetase C family protein [Yinghuangia sp. ASG 101]
MADADEAALLVADRLRDPGVVVAATASPGSLASGLAGTALLHACLARHHARFAEAAREHWRVAAQHPTAPDGVYTGPGGLAASLILGAPYMPDPDVHRPAVARAAAWLSARARGVAEHQRRRTRPGAPWAVYDTIKGLAGIGRILLAAQQSGHDTEHGLTAVLTTLATLVSADDQDRPGWWLPADEHPVPVPPPGAATTGMAHGIAGPLALLSTAHASGRTVPGQVDAIRTAADWLTTRQESEGSWPPHIPEPSGAPPGRRHAWCYGTPGIAAALIAAAEALNDDKPRRVAVHALDELAATHVAAWDTEGPTFCHGTAGILHASRRLGHYRLADRATAATLAAFDHGHPYGIARVEHGRLLHEPGLLAGASGTALVLADFAGLLPRGKSGSWDSVMLLS